MMQRIQHRIAFAIALTLPLAACGGGGSSSGLPSPFSPVTLPAGHAKSAAQFTIEIPKAVSAPSAALRANSSLTSAASASVRRPQYVSVNTASATITLTSVNGKPAPAGYPAVTTPLTTGSSACNSQTPAPTARPAVRSTTTCSVSVSAPPGSDAFTVTLSDASAHPLSTNSEIVTVAAGRTTTAQPLVLGGIAASYALLPAFDAATTAHVTSNAGNVTIVGSQPWICTLEPIDASGAFIIGPGTPNTSLTSPSSALTVTAISGMQNQYSLTFGQYAAQPVSLTAKAVGGATAPISATSVQEIWVGDAYNHVYGMTISGTTLSPIPSDTITLTAPNAAPYNLAFDHAGNLWVVDGDNNVITSYKPGVATPRMTIQPTSSGTDSIAFDAAGHLWSAGSALQEFDASTGAVISNPLSGLTLSSAFIAFNTAGNLYVAQLPNTVSAYSPTGSTTPIVSFTEPGEELEGLAFNGNGNLWLADQYGTSWKAYDATTGAPIAGVSAGVAQYAANSIGLDGGGNVWITQGSEFNEVTGNGSPIATYTGPTGGYYGITFAPQSPSLVRPLQ